MQAKQLLPVSSNMSYTLQEAQRKLLEKGLEEEMLCAYVNNNMRCYNESTDFADTMEEALEPGCKACFQILLPERVAGLKLR